MTHKIHYPGDRFAYLRSLCKLPHVMSAHTTTDIAKVTCLNCLSLLARKETKQ